MFDVLDMGWIEFQNHVRLQARELGQPAFGTFELTPLCNFACKMCYVRLAPDEMRERGRLRSAAEWLDMARQAREAGTIGITLTGGEVLTRPDFAEIYTGVVDQGLIPSILSNGSLVDEDVVALFSERPPAHMRFTLYGASNETYERLCGVSGGFDRVMRGLHLLSDAGLIFSLAFTETTENIGDLEGVIKIAAAFGTSPTITANLAPAVRGATSEAARLRIQPEGRAPIGSRTAEIETSGCRASASEAASECPRDLFSRCTMHRSGFWIDWNGTMEPCGFMSYCKSRPFEQGFEAAWHDMHEKLAALELPKRCASCPDYSYCSACPGLRDAMTGSPTGTPEALCRDAQTRHASAQRRGAR